MAREIKRTLRTHVMFGKYDLDLYTKKHGDKFYKLADKNMFGSITQFNFSNTNKMSSRSPVGRPDWSCEKDGLSLKLGTQRKVRSTSESPASRKDTRPRINDMTALVSLYTTLPLCYNK